ncbi:MAG: ribosome-associated translation inhibitor RaiA [Candidatus Latescibacteria bacterium]|nr:ribosome-associated translation inhibitor RaiA [Candidatus Latescibacterota bacterium]NIM22092.1 ribosome-associated translation inhibitor RaiA [Candidatus Latescibacterota bacterium]NIM66111.1 ribosome-associated translation inhibitor RaiA [Candidatus Latescibacterota bacterium]NIO02519.1 ribosome-associated translation inhibitor RaiA [Candidatus Latescibacterota bacterium]NIO29430.1 ribosome-associated translation inhibitor RaiA [Candidatus Latescibacterota bacterium]
MKVTTTARHYELTPALKDYAESKVYHLKKYFDQIVNAHITFTLEKYRHTVEITVHVNGRDFKSKDVSEDMYASVDGAVEKLERQILKHKGKRQKRKNQAKITDVEVVLVENVDDVEGETTESVEEFVTARSDEFPQLTPEEAIREMKGNGIDFKIFLNATTKKVNILFRREDGKYGLIEA